jgi:hypothetical protein
MGDTEQTMGGPIAFADWWSCDEKQAREHVARVAWEQRGNVGTTCVELGVRRATLRGEQRHKPWAQFIKGECARARALLRPVKRRSETRVSEGMMGAWR